jgi:hypothetical protein
MGVRRITNGGRKVIGKFPSIKNGRMVWWESQIERDYLYLLEIDPDVVSYEEQPLKIRYYLDGEPHLYTPDLRVIRRDKQQIVEVKDKKAAVREEYVELFRRVAPICQDQGYEFVVVTDQDIRIQPKLDNIKLICKYAKASVTSVHQILLYSLFADMASLTLEEIIGGFASKGIPNSVVYALIYRGILSVDLMQPIGKTSVAQMSLPLTSQRRKTA